MENSSPEAVSTPEPPKRQPQLLSILQYPHPLLSEVSAPIVADIKTDATLQSLLDDMVHTMRSAQAAGLAAVQVGQAVRALVVMTDAVEIGPEGRLQRVALKVINPRLVEVSEEKERVKEGCLSFMGLFINVVRPVDVTVEYYNEHGVLKTTFGDGTLGRAIQHEMDHLEGKTFLDRVSNYERREALRKNTFAKRKVKALSKAISAAR